MMGSEAKIQRYTKEIGENECGTTVSMDYFFLGTAGVQACKDLGAALAKNTTITDLGFRHNQMEHEHLEHILPNLCNHPSLTKLNLEHNQISNPATGKLICDLLTQNANLRTLNIAEAHVSDEAMEQIAAGLAKSGSILELFAHHNQIGDRSATALASALKQNKSLHTLQLERMFRNMDQDGPTISWEGVKAFEAALTGPKKNKSLRNFDISHHDHLDSIGGKHMGAILADPECTIVELHLNSTEMGPEGCAHIAHALRLNTSLTTLHMDWNLAGPQAGAEFANALLENTSLAHVSLMSNKMEDVGAGAFANMLRHNRTLGQLSVTDNDITSHGAQSILEGMKENFSVSAISYHSDHAHPIEERISKTIDKFMERNKPMPLAPRAQVGTFWVTPPLGSRLIHGQTVIPELVPAVLWEDWMAAKEQILDSGDKIGTATKLQGFAKICEFFGDSTRKQLLEEEATMLRDGDAYDSDKDTVDAEEHFHGKDGHCCSHAH
eukprot:TRINITY_DN33663_c0_g1_i1.p1 TRINITY_DN33663_c0_g1~~TRINITY_DN33663_c0_g1_i1.p1  ORF type:complete len:512 (-),score=32.46 TRINITY_DN33663_c0_g1_i1:130-1617(-)